MLTYNVCSELGDDDDGVFADLKDDEKKGPTEKTKGIVNYDDDDDVVVDVSTAELEKDDDTVDVDDTLDLKVVTLDDEIPHEVKIKEESGKKDFLPPLSRDSFQKLQKSVVDSMANLRGSSLEESTLGITHIDLTALPDVNLTRHMSDKRGSLICNGQRLDSEVIYWEDIPEDKIFESPITPHHGDHHDKYITFEYDNGGWNNVRMSLECVIVIAHAMGRTLVIPPQQHLYLLGKTHKDEGDQKAHDEMGFEDFFDIDLLKSHQGYHTITMKEFLEREACKGSLGNEKTSTKGLLPKGNSSDLWGQELWWYLNKVADYTPEWAGRFMAFPDRAGDFKLTQVHHPRFKERMKAFGGERNPVFYDDELQNMHHIHIPGDSNHRVLQHHYAFAFFASPTVQSFYRRFVRDFLRYKDSIHCYGASVVAAVRADSLKENPTGNGEYYALHIRRGDFQFKDVKIGAEEMVKNLNFAVDGKPLIPRGAIVYLSTDDPKGVCHGCMVNRIPCAQYEAGKKPPGACCFLSSSLHRLFC